MEQTRNINLPIIGVVQHGIQIQNSNGTKRAKELGHFIAKIQDDYMHKFLQKFDSLYTGKKYIEIEFVDNNPLSKKYVRYNQGGDVCHCIEGHSIGSKKTNNGWKPVECNTEQCQYRQRNENGKAACNRIGWLKFFIPSISTDRIWLMKITGQQSISRLDDYINYQKSQGNSLKGRYILFLKQEEQESKFTGQRFNNYNLDILRKEDFISSDQNSLEVERIEQLPTSNAQNVNSNAENQEKNVNELKVVNNTQEKNKKTETSKTSKKSAKSQTKKNKDKEENKNKEEVEDLYKHENYYFLESTYNGEVIDKNGNKKNYLIGIFYDMSEKENHIVIKPEDAAELQTCDLGTLCEIQIKDALGKKFAVDLKFIEKRIKREVA